MLIYIKLSWRNIWRHKRRSLIVIFSIGLGIFFMLITMALVNGMNYQMIDNTISTSLGHVSVHRKGFTDNVKASYSFTPEVEFYSRLDEIPEVAGWAPRVKTEGIVRSSEASQGVLIVGVDPEKEKSVSEIFQYTLTGDGSEFLRNASAGDVLISDQLAGKLDLVIGDRLVIMLQDSSDEISGEALTVRGVFRSPIDSFDKYVIFTGIKKLQDVMGLEKRISEISIRAVTRDDSTSVKKSVSVLLKDPEIEALTWQEMSPSMMSAIKLYDAMMFIFFGIIFTTVIFSVANTMIMAVMERFHEIGVMKCIGTRPLNVFIMIIFEAVNLGLVGMGTGMLCGVVFNIVFGIIGVDLSIFSDSMRVWGTGSVIYPMIMLKDITAAAVIVLLTAVISAVYPAYKAAKIRPLEALNYI